MEDTELAILKAIIDVNRDFGALPNFMVKSNPPDKIRLVFCNKIEPTITFGNWTCVTVTPQDFSDICQAYPELLEDMRRREFHRD